MKILIRAYDPDRDPRLFTYEVDAAECGVPGLAIHAREGEPGYAVTHVRSGLAAACADDPETALGVAVALGELMSDWTISADDICDEVSTWEVREAARSAGGWIEQVKRSGIDKSDLVSDLAVVTA